ncbi:DUF1573 domain-containing protein [bacterium]|nr:DUF1573 domain-containing protein [bacterium]
MSRFIPLIVVSVVLMVVGLIWWSQPISSGGAAGSPDQRTKSAGQIDSAADSHKSEKKPDSKNSEEKKEKTTKTSPPQAVVDETLYDFGVLPRFTKGTHIFVIKNEGLSPLSLKKGESSCSCTLLGMEDSDVPPGGQAEIKLEWTLKFKEGAFEQSALVHTNDPEMSEIEFRVKGLIETRFAFSEPSLAFSKRIESKGASQDTFLVSRTWSDMEDLKFKSDDGIKGLKIEILPATKEDLKMLEVRSARKIRVELPENMEPGHHIAQVEFTGREANSQQENPEETSRKLTVEANIDQPGVAFYSPLIDGFGRIKLGKIDQEKGSELMKLNFRVDEGSTPWEPKEIVCYPEFVETKIVKINEKLGLFQLQIKIPPGSPAGSYYGQRIGQIAITSEHPLVPKIPVNRSGLLLEFHIE